MKEPNLTSAEREYLESLITSCGRRSFHVKQCYRNAQRLLIADKAKRLRYWEGRLDGEIPHAWLTINGKLFDPTLVLCVREQVKLMQGFAQSLGFEYDSEEEKEESHHYEGGRVVDRRRVLRNFFAKNEYGPVLEDMAHLVSGGKIKRDGRKETHGHGQNSKAGRTRARA